MNLLAVPSANYCLTSAVIATGLCFSLPVFANVQNIEKVNQYNSVLVSQNSAEWLNKSHLIISQESTLSNRHHTFSQAELTWIGKRIYANECASKPDNLIHWNDGENFPSLGIGHFIWYAKGRDEKFIETFPSLLNELAKKKPPPDWLSDLPTMDAPWPNKKAFLAFKRSPQYQELLTWLLSTQPEQAKFISEQLFQRFNKFLKQADLLNSSTDQRRQIEQLFNKLMAFKQGRFALIDYVNFKGMGAKTEAYQGEQWGLISVFKDMLLRHPEIHQWQNLRVLQEFVVSAKNRLQNRVDLSPAERKEQRWLKGWFTRVESYLKE